MGIMVLMAKCCNHCSAQSLFATVTIVPQFFLSFFFLDQRKVYSKSLVQGALTWSIEVRKCGEKKERDTVRRKRKKKKGKKKTEGGCVPLRGSLSHLSQASTKLGRL